ncbi:DUF1674 domain-containing protein [Faunimonas sp. B44]|uniref:DUF1674 domain-containing protein n=1 Tax=Faunimonas sp. B44 TaxID=3461493 RepID=UPI004044E17E
MDERTAGKAREDGRPLTPEAERALAEAAERRREREAAERAAGPAPRELDGPKGPEPVRYGDWEQKGRATDF